MKYISQRLVYSPSDLVLFLGSPFASWMDRYYLENPNGITPDPETEDAKLIAETGNEHERRVLADLKKSTPELVEIVQGTSTIEGTNSIDKTKQAIAARAPIIYQAALAGNTFAGFADFLLLDNNGKYQVWDTKLARSPKPYFAIQLCCYSEMWAHDRDEEKVAFEIFLDVPYNRDTSRGNHKRNSLSTNGGGSQRVYRRAT